MSGIRVGIADDNKGFCEILTDFLSQQEGIIPVFTAYDGMETVKAVVKEKPDVLILDMSMPRMDGLGVLESLKEMNVSPFPKVIMLSADGGEFATRQAISLGAEHYVVKPFNLEILTRRIMQVATYDTVPYHLTDSKQTAKSIAAAEARREVSLVSEFPVVFQNLDLEDINFEELEDQSVVSTGCRREMTWDPEELEFRITAVLKEIGVPVHMRGYQFLKTGIAKVIEDEDLINAVTKELYPEIGKVNSSTGTRVERSIRNVIEVAWTKGNLEAIHRLFGYTINSEKGKPTNSQFIAIVAEKIRLERQHSAAASF